MFGGTLNKLVSSLSLNKGYKTSGFASHAEMSETPDVLSFQDLYIDRPLPYLIGSQQFMEQDDVGLGDLSSEGMCWHDLLFLCK